MLKRLIATAAASVAAFVASPALAHTPMPGRFVVGWRTIDQMIEKVNMAGTDVTMEPCIREGTMGWYFYAEDIEGNVISDELRICTNTTDMTNSSQVWEVLVHEATHVMQACQGDTIVKDDYHPDIRAEIRVKDPATYNLVLEYDPEDQKHEWEAFWMEFQEPQFALNMMDRYCGEYYRM